LGLPSSITVQDFENVNSHSIEQELINHLPQNQSSIFIVESLELLTDPNLYEFIVRPDGKSPFDVFSLGFDVAMIINTSTLADQDIPHRTFHWICFVLKHINSDIIIEIMDSNHNTGRQKTLIRTATKLRDDLLQVLKTQKDNKTNDDETRDDNEITSNPDPTSTQFTKPTHPIPRSSTSDLSHRPLKLRKTNCSGKSPNDCLGH
jgi:hypothetical protein